jgi:hypothetical protein
MLMSADPASWPPGFLWGVSTSGHQYDGNNVASDYWALEHLDVPLFAEPSGDALNSYHPVAARHGAGGRSRVHRLPVRDRMGPYRAGPRLLLVG